MRICQIDEHEIRRASFLQFAHRERRRLCAACRNGKECFLCTHLVAKPPLELSGQRQSLHLPSHIRSSRSAANQDFDSVVLMVQKRSNLCIVR